MLSLAQKCVCALVVCVLALCDTKAVGQCTPQWSSEFSPSGFVGTVTSLIEFDDGSGPALFAGGSFSFAPGGVPCRTVAKWDGNEWRDASVGMNNPDNASGVVRTMCIHDAGDGNGPGLYAGGNFWISRSGGHSFGVGRWDGTRWAGVGSGPGSLNQSIRSLVSFHTGGRQQLVAAGDFVSYGARTYRGFALWNGTTWEPAGSGLRRADGTAGIGMSLAVFDDGSGPRLYLGGQFETADGAVCANLARWTGVTFEPIGEGVRFSTGTGAFVRALRATTIGGPSLLVGGAFDRAGNQPVANAARYNGVEFSSLGNGLGPAGTSSNYVATFNEYGGAIYAGGIFASTNDGVVVNNLARLTNLIWQPVAPGAREGVFALHPCTLCNDAPLLIAGSYLYATWDGEQYHSLDRGRALSGSSYAGLVADLGGGSALYVAGNFSLAGLTRANRVAKWTGEEWEPLGTGFSCTSDRWPMVVYDDGTGKALYIASCGGIWRWDGSVWVLIPPEPRMTAYVEMAVFDRGDGPRLYVLGGHYDTSVSNNLYRLSSWDGREWRHIASAASLSFPRGNLTVVEHRGDNLPAGLYINASFRMFGSIVSNGLVRYNGYTLFPVGPADGVETSSGGDVAEMVVAGPLGGRGRSIYLGGSMYRVGGLPITNGLAGWDGTEWFQPSGDGAPALGQPSAMTVFDDGRGEAIYAAGSFSRATGEPTRTQLVRYGASGYEVVAEDFALSYNLRAMVPMGTGRDRAIFFLGNLSTFNGQPAGNIVRLDLCPGCPADWDQNGVLNTNDFFRFVEALLSGYADLNRDGVTNTQDYFDFLTSFFQGC